MLFSFKCGLAVIGWTAAKLNWSLTQQIGEVKRCPSAQTWPRSPCAMFFFPSAKNLVHRVNSWWTCAGKKSQLKQKKGETQASGCNRVDCEVRFV